MWVRHHFSVPPVLFPSCFPLPLPCLADPPTPRPDHLGGWRAEARPEPGQALGGSHHAAGHVSRGSSGGRTGCSPRDPEACDKCLAPWGQGGPARGLWGLGRGPPSPSPDSGLSQRRGRLETRKVLVRQEWGAASKGPFLSALRGSPGRSRATCLGGLGLAPEQGLRETH